VNRTSYEASHYALTMCSYRMNSSCLPPFWCA